MLVAERRGRPGGRRRRTARHRRPAARPGRDRRRPGGFTHRRRGRSAPPVAAGTGRGRTTSRWSSTPPAPPRGRSSCRSPTPTSPPRPRHIGATLGADAGRPLPQHHAALPYPRPDRGGARLARRRRQRRSARRASTRSASSRWLDEAKPTWYTAVPTMHQAILARAARNPEAVAASRLRFIRSSSASLPPQVMAELEATFRCPVIESYGMTEAAHQMASNPLPPRARKPGSVGIAAGPEVAIMADGRRAARRRRRSARSSSAGRTSPPATRTTRRPTPTPSPTAGSTPATRARWTTTAIVRVTGRLKEIINRGGEKISPREVDEVLMDHPAVAQVVTFAMPHDKLGEEVAAAVVLREGSDGERARDPRFRRRPARRLQGAAQDRHPRRDPEGRDRQAAAHRPRRRSSASADAGLRLRRRRDRRLPRRQARRRRARSTVAGRARRRISTAIRARRPDADRGRQRRRPIRVTASDRRRPSSAPQDYVVLALKAHSVAGRARRDRAAARPGHRRRHHAERRAVVVLLPPRRAARGNAHRGGRPGRRASGSASDRSAAIGCVVYPAAEVEAPGVDPPRRRRPLLARRAVGREERARRARSPTS